VFVLFGLANMYQTPETYAMVTKLKAKHGENHPKVKEFVAEVESFSKTFNDQIKTLKNLSSKKSKSF
jgi:hypothetical protein